MCNFILIKFLPREWNNKTIPPLSICDPTSLTYDITNKNIKEGNPIIKEIHERNFTVNLTTIKGYPIKTIHYTPLTIFHYLLKEKENSGIFPSDNNGGKISAAILLHFVIELMVCEIYSCSFSSVYVARFLRLRGMFIYISIQFECMLTL